MKQSMTILCVIGTRPEAIKMVPVISTFKQDPHIRCIVIATAQHRDLLDQILEHFDIHVDHDLNMMMDKQSPSDLLARMLPVLDRILVNEKPDIVLAQGDTTTVLGAALSAFHRNIPFGHVEAGLRTYNLDHPFPEEGYRQMISRLSRWHFAPTENSAMVLLREGIPQANIHLTGNTGIDTLLKTIDTLDTPPKLSLRIILVTVHRRESFGEPLREIFSALLDIANQFPDVYIVYPVHPNPQVKEIAYKFLSDHPRIELREPMDYLEFVNYMKLSTLILTDSGGVQEEAPALGKPVLVLRETTERPEAISAGVAKLVGTRKDNIVKSAATLLSDNEFYSAMAKGVSPYGDGHAAERIHRILSSTELYPSKTSETPSLS